ncbi:GHMP family kinase ATP-binding protein [Marinobacter zhejiangensis]|uniref:Threonine kinase n=1 Tax=Marinobacter zhejiangensis TaxID=488535 RepID=A0A1I4TN55_9GAMM|nr:GHMP kinase [Marinobacter zhejiangensis]SFM77977.1 threonine kinase [Marinobacter zhejiangensis]
MQAVAGRSISNTKTHSGVTRLKAPGTCGELVQGALDGQDFLINCPIDLYSYATVKGHPEPGLHISSPGHFSKIRDTLLLASEQHDLELAHELNLFSDIPRGKGMASSSADITAAFMAVNDHCGVSLGMESFASVVTEIEPSDCVNFPGIAHLNHLTGHLFESLPAPTGLKVLIVDCGGNVDTITFDRLRARSIYKAHEAYLRDAVATLKRGLITGDLDAVAYAATCSARLNQQIMFKPQFDPLLQFAMTSGALGVNCAHSGTVLGVLFREADELEAHLRTHIAKRFGDSLQILGTFNVIGGGAHEFE